MSISKLYITSWRADLKVYAIISIVKYTLAPLYYDRMGISIILYWLHDN